MNEFPPSYRNMPLLHPTVIDAASRGRASVAHDQGVRLDEVDQRLAFPNDWKFAPGKSGNFETVPFYCEEFLFHNGENQFRFDSNANRVVIVGLMFSGLEKAFQALAIKVNGTPRAVYPASFTRNRSDRMFYLPDGPKAFVMKQLSTLEVVIVVRGLLTPKEAPTFPVAIVFPERM